MEAIIKGADTTEGSAEAAEAAAAVESLTVSKEGEDNKEGEK
jgi:hypothetical protein